MPNPENILPHRFKPGQSGNPKGRPRNRVPDTIARIFGSKTRARSIRESAITRSEANTWEQIVISLPLDLLKALAKSELTPAYAKGLAIALMSDMKEGNIKTLAQLREWQYGKAAQPVEMSGELAGPGPIEVEIIDRREQADTDTPPGPAADTPAS